MADVRTWMGAALIGMWLVSGTSLAQQTTEPFDDAERQAIEAIIADYILDNPEIVYRALQVLQERQQAAQAEQARQALDAHREVLERDPNSPVGGNPEGDVTVVEFFDYRCPYCKRAAPDVERLTAEDGELRFVYKEWPILGPESDFAARAALAAREQGHYLDFHDRLMALREVNEANVMAAARELGLDLGQLRRDMAAPEVEAHLRQTAQLAQALGINGTPAFVIGDQVVPGAAGYETLSGLIEAAREARE